MSNGVSVYLIEKINSALIFGCVTPSILFCRWKGAKLTYKTYFRQHILCSALLTYRMNSTAFKGCITFPNLGTRKTRKAH